MFLFLPSPPLILTPAEFFIIPTILTTFISMSFCTWKVKMSVTWPWLTLCDSIDCSSLPASSVHGILQARILEGVAIPFSKGSSQPRDRNQACCTAGRLFIVWATSEALYVCVYKTWKKVKLLLAQSCPTLWDPMNCSSPGSSVHGIHQASILK